MRATAVLIALNVLQLGAQTPSTRTIAVDGRAMRIYAEGLERRAPGDPVVVFEAGAATTLDVWSAIPRRVAQHVPVVAYDRSGLGQSVWDDQPPTPAHVTAKLRRMLQQIGAPPPYILVGWSWGGTLARFYAGYFPADVAGIVYLDPGPIVTNTPEEEIAPFVEIGAGRAGYDAFWDAFRGMRASSPPAIRAEFDVFYGLMRRDLRDRDLRPAPKVPAAIIVAAKPAAIGIPLPFDQMAYAAADIRHRIRLLQRWVLDSPHGTLVAATNATHFIPRDDPDLVVSTIERVLAAVRAARRTPGGSQR
jgi:pimeloyl-ACP methyl ester carboxylesterase